MSYNPKIQEGLEFAKYFFDTYPEDIERFRLAFVPVVDRKGKIIYKADGKTPVQIAPRLEVVFRS